MRKKQKYILISKASILKGPTHCYDEDYHHYLLKPTGVLTAVRKPLVSQVLPINQLRLVTQRPETKRPLNGTERSLVLLMVPVFMRHYIEKWNKAVLCEITLIIPYISTRQLGF